MCGLIAFTGELNDGLTEKLLESLERIRYRGPDHSAFVKLQRGAFGFNRLAIMDTSSDGVQPFHFKQQGLSLVCNGEIYNFRKLRDQFHESYAFSSASDCEVLLPAYLEFGIEGMLKEIDGEYAFVIYDGQRDQFIAARDPMGIRPLFYGKDSQGSIHFASEAKALQLYCEEIKPFPPGHYYQGGKFHCFLDLTADTLHSDDMETVFQNIHDKLSQAVIKRLDSDVPVGFLLSGGLDSSLVCAIAARQSDKPISTFAIGINDKPIDTHYARIVAEHLGTDHHEVLFTREEMLEALDELIYKLETYDITTIRASVGMYLLSKYVKEKTDIKVILTGECSDELFGYKYTDFAPDADSFQTEAEKRIRELYMYDVLRADRCISSNSLEPRVPFSDTDFVQYVMGIDPSMKMNSYDMGKYLLRKAFDHSDYLPQEILYRDKAAFSDAVGHAAVDTLKELAEEKYSAQDLLDCKSKFSHATPFTKESLMYREIFESHFPKMSEMVDDFWMPNREWDNCDVADPSARALPNYGDSGSAPQEIKKLIKKKAK